MKSRNLTAAAAVVVALVAAGAGRATPPPAYDVVDVGVLGTAAGSFGQDVNSAGVVVGQSADHAFVWTEIGGMRDLGTFGGPRSSADHVTEEGQVVGYAYVNPSNWHPFSWTADDGMVDVGTLGGPNASANDVSGTGQIVGQSNWAGFPPALKAFSWTASGGIADLGLLSGVTIALGVNDAGQVVGWSGHAFLWTQSTGMRDLGTLDGGPISAATDVNDHGQVVGWSGTPDGVHAFSWTAESGMVDLGPAISPAVAINDAGEIAFARRTADGATHVMFLAPAGSPLDIGTLGGANTTLGGIQFPGLALNDAGQVVGSSSTSGGPTHGYVWSLATGMVDLGTLGGAQSQAVAISENGLITGTSNTTAGSIHAVLWKAHPSDTTPPTLHVPDGIAVDATSPSGAVVTYAATATDDVDPAPAVECEPHSGTLFAIGDTTVTCTAVDAAGNTATATFVVHVRGAEEQVDALLGVVRLLPVNDGLTTSLAVKLDETMPSRLAAFVHEVDAQAGKALTETQADELRVCAERIRAVLGN